MAHLLVVAPLIAFHHKLMRPDQQPESILVVPLRRDVLPEDEPGATRRDGPACSAPLNTRHCLSAKLPTLLWRDPAQLERVCFGRRTVSPRPTFRVCRVTPQQITDRTFVRDFLYPVPGQSGHLKRRTDGGGTAAVTGTGAGAGAGAAGLTATGSRPECSSLARAHRGPCRSFRRPWPPAVGSRRLR